MYIEFRTSKLEKCYLERRARHAAWGEQVARQYVKAINLLKAVRHPDDLRGFPTFGYHPLAQNRKGQHAMKLADRVRLIFTVQGGSECLIARVEEVSTTHYDH